MGCVKFIKKRPDGSDCVVDVRLNRVIEYLHTPFLKYALAVSVLFFIAASVSNAQPYSGTIFFDPDIITSSDSSSFSSISYAGQGMRTMYDRRSGWVTINAFLFDVNWNDGLSCEAQVNPEFGSVNAAATEAEKYARLTGQLPTCLREDVDYLWIHAGTEAFGGGNNSILIHTGQSVLYENDGILEETLVHEASHTSLDATHASADGWIEAQNLDPDFISTYAKDNPQREDIAESFLPWLAVRYRRDRISETDYNKIVQTIPNRLNYFDNINFDMFPVSVITSSGNAWEYPKDNKKIIVYPNPAGDILNIDSYTSGPFEVKMWSANGNCIGSYRLKGNTSVDLSGIPEGLYLLETKINNEIITVKIVKSR